ncbi:uncharacterized protein LOC129001890 [Macrosteles quadrilineatus]|uniref:uncharacterized protein LOC129001890 n=1 Tax=Macrosteles quadrilineatus TaxID=74068 RepID=UPI0023E1DC7A|nr:uncharacterized protein LOC129001890 [Macrosteles quadrilineatus]
MSNIPPELQRNEKPIPKEAMKFLKLSPSVKVMSLKKSSTTSCRVRPSQAGLNNDPLAGGSEEPPIRMRQLHKDRKMISVLSAKSGKEARRQFIERSDSEIGERQNSWKDEDNVDMKSGAKEKPKHWYGRWMDALLSAVK